MTHEEQLLYKYQYILMESTLVFNAHILLETFFFYAIYAMHLDFGEQRVYLEQGVGTISCNLDHDI